MDVIQLFSDEVDTDDAMQDLLEQAQKALSGIKSTTIPMPIAGIVFYGIHFEAKIIAQTLMTTWPTMALVGCSTDGEISTENAYSEDSISLVLICGDTLQAQALSFSQQHDVEHTTTDNECASPLPTSAKWLLQQSLSLHKNPPKLAILITDVLSLDVNTEALIDIIHEVIPETAVFGASAGDGWAFDKVSIIQGQTINPGAALLLLYGDIHIQAKADADWDLVGDIGVVTKAEGATVFEIDGKPALEFYNNRFAMPLSPEPELPLSIRNPHTNDHLFLRSTTGQYDTNSGSITYLGVVPEGAQVAIAAVNRNLLIDSAKLTATQALSGFSEQRPPKLAIIFSCATRHQLLGPNTHKEVLAAQTIFGDTLPMVGFYCYGEICPNEPNDKAYFHHQTFTLLLIG